MAKQNESGEVVLVGLGIGKLPPTRLCVMTKCGFRGFRGRAPCCGWRDLALRLVRYWKDLVIFGPQPSLLLSRIHPFVKNLITFYQCGKQAGENTASSCHCCSGYAYRFHTVAASAQSAGPHYNWPNGHEPSLSLITSCHHLLLRTLQVGIFSFWSSYILLSLSLLWTSS